MSSLPSLSPSLHRLSPCGDFTPTIRRAFIVVAIALAAIGMIAIFAQIDHFKDLTNLLKPFNWGYGIPLTIASLVGAFLLSSPDLLRFCSQPKKTKGSQRKGAEICKKGKGSEKKDPVVRRETTKGFRKKGRGIKQPPLVPTIHIIAPDSPAVEKPRPQEGSAQGQPMLRSNQMLAPPTVEQPSTDGHFLETPSVFTEVVPLDVPQGKISQDTLLLQSPFYLGAMDRKSAEKLVKYSKTPGTWFLRYSNKQKDYCITFINKVGVVEHRTVRRINKQRNIDQTLKISSSGTNLKEFFGFLKNLKTRPQFAQETNSLGWDEETHLMNQPLGYTPYCLGYSLDHEDIKERFAASQDGAWCVRRSKSTKGAFVLCVKEKGQICEYKTLDKLSLNTSLAAVLETYNLKLSDYVDCKVKVTRFTIENKEIPIYTSKREAALGLSDHKYVIRETRRGDYFLGYRNKQGNRVFKLLAYNSLSEHVNLDSLLSHLEDQTFVPPILGLVDTNSFPCTENGCKYPRQLILNLGSGSTQNALINKNKKNFGDATTIEHVDLRRSLKDTQVETALAMQKLQPGDRVYLIGHGNPGSDSLSSDEDYKYTVEHFVKMFKCLDIKHKQQPLIISVIACYGGSNNADQPSFCEALSKALDREGINAVVYGRTGSIARWIGKDPTQYKKLVSLGPQQGLQHKGRGSKIKFTTINGMHSQEWIYGQPAN